MPEADFSGDVFKLDASAGFDEGIVSGQVGSGARLSFATRFELCHGVAADLAAEAVAQAVADLGLLWAITGHAEGEALAAAGVQLDAQVTIDLFDRVGVSAEMAAFAEASLAGRLSVALDMGEIALLARESLTGPALEVFQALLRESRIEAGVWGKISFAAMAKARLNIRGSLADDRNAGFVVEMGAEAGLAAGAGYDFYAGVLLENPKRFFVNATDAITGAILEEARRSLPRSLHPHLAALEYVLPATLATAYELAQSASATLATRPDEAGDILVDCFLAELQRFALDKLGLAAMTLLARSLDIIGPDLQEAEFTDGERDAAADAIRTLINALEGKPLTFSTLGTLVPDLGDLLESIAPNRRSEWRPLLAALWLALAAAESVRQGVIAAGAQASANVVGLRAAAAGAFQVVLPQTPEIVGAELEPFIGEVPDRLDLAAVVDYLVLTRLPSLLEDVLSELPAILQVISRKTGTTPSDLIQMALRGTAGEAPTNLSSYPAWRGITVTILDELVVEQLLPALADAIPEGNDSRVWLDEAVRPALIMMRDFVLERVEDLVTGDPDGAGEESLRTGLSLMIGKIVLGNVVVLADILLGHVMNEMTGAAARTSALVRGSEGHAVARAADRLVKDLLPPNLPWPETLPDASRELAAEMLLVVSDVTRPNIFTLARRARLRDLMRRLLFSVYGEADLSSPRALDDSLSQVAACTYLPAPDAVIDLLALQGEILSDQVTTGLPRTSKALERFFKTVTLDLLASTERSAGEALRDTRDLIVSLARTILAFSRDIQRLIEEIGTWAREREAGLDAAAAALRSSRRRREILDRLALDGMAEAERLARGVPGFDSLSVELQEAAVATATGAFFVAFSLARPLLDLALQALSVVADKLADLFGAAANMAELMAKLADAVNDAVESEIVALAGLDLPRELSIADVCDAAVAIVTGFPLIRDSLLRALNAREAELEAQRQRAQREARAAAARERKLRMQRRLSDAVVKAPARIIICSPQPLSRDMRHAWTYGDEVPLRLTIVNVPRVANTALGKTPGPVLLALNGAPVRLLRGAWRVHQGRATLETYLNRNNSSLRPGVNVVECSYADSVHPPVRVTVLFLSHATPPGDDARTSFERDGFAIKPGRVPIAIERWREYRFAGKKDCPETLTLVDHCGRMRAEKLLLRGIGNDKETVA